MNKTIHTIGFLKSLLIGFALVCSLKIKSQINKSVFNILGSWRLERRASADNYPLNKHEERECIGDEVIFRKDTIIAPKDTCFYGEGCGNPNYNYKVVNALKLFEGDSSFIKKIGYTKDSIGIIITDSNSCGVPFGYIYILNENSIVCGMDSYIFFLKRDIPSSKDMRDDRGK